ncbi:MAG: Chromate transport protein [Firmicutes bacterium ADurb.Bin506]|jgi:chromate transporter|nr:MAG: Chromate transport protein [Firmicutes bacterium ADurb.Bin506]
MSISPESNGADRQAACSRASLTELFWTFFRIGAFTIGGGYVMIPLIQKDIVDKHGWLSKDEFVDILAVAQTAPGALAINTATYVGFELRGIVGSLVSVAGCALPSIIIITLVAAMFSQVASAKVVQAAFAGIRPAVVVLILSAVVKIGKPIMKSGRDLMLAAAALLAVAAFGISTPLVIVAAALVGVALKMGGVKR